MRLSKAIKIPRNSPCYCGSGKKYKKCCSIREDEQRSRQLTVRSMVEDDKKKADEGKIEEKEVIQDSTEESQSGETGSD
jgi:uncharacterized protein YecA (UPF0149 family)